MEFREVGIFSYKSKAPILKTKIGAFYELT
jgi:hypothetical protein